MGKKNTSSDQPKNKVREPDIIEIKVPGKSEYVGVVRLVMVSIANRMAFTNENTEDIKIAVGEACINVIKHAYHKDFIDKEIIVRCLIYPNKLTIIIKDKGVGFSPLFVQQYVKRSYVSKDKKVGLGIFLIKSLMDEVEYDKNLPTGTQVRMIKYTTPS
ncbi:MAG: ATP-binding protein [bacterium]